MTTGRRFTRNNSAPGSTADDETKHHYTTTSFTHFTTNRSQKSQLIGPMQCTATHSALYSLNTVTGVVATATVSH